MEFHSILNVEKAVQNMITVAWLQKKLLNKITKINVACAV